MTRWIAGAIAVWTLALVTATGQARRTVLSRAPSINTPRSTIAGRRTTDPVTTLHRDLSAGTATLAFEGPHGFLRALLARLEVPVESQVLLFSKTGIQHPFTDPEHPRALYFNDRVVVGYIPGGAVHRNRLARRQAGRDLPDA